MSGEHYMVACVKCNAWTERPEGGTFAICRTCWDGLKAPHVTPTSAPGVKCDECGSVHTRAHAPGCSREPRVTPMDERSQVHEASLADLRARLERAEAIALALNVSGEQVSGELEQWRARAERAERLAAQRGAVLAVNGFHVCDLPECWHGPKLDPAALQAALDEARGRAERAEAELRQVRASNDELLGIVAGNERAADYAEARAEKAEAEVAKLRAALERIRGIASTYPYGLPYSMIAAIDDASALLAEVKP